MNNVFLIFTIFLLSGCLSSKVTDICPFNQDGNCPACKIVEKEENIQFTINIFKRYWK